MCILFQSCYVFVVEESSAKSCRRRLFSEARSLKVNYIVEFLTEEFSQYVLW